MRGFRSTRSAVVAAAMVFVTAGCGGEEESTASEEPTASETPVAPVDVQSFQNCILNGSVEVGSYEQIDSTATEVTTVASDNDATMFAASKSDDGFAYFFVPSDPSVAEEMQLETQEAVVSLRDRLAETAPKGVELGEASAAAVGETVVVGVIPFSADKQQEIAAEAAADALHCTEQPAG